MRSRRVVAILAAVLAGPACSATNSSISNSNRELDVLEFSGMKFAQRPDCHDFMCCRFSSIEVDSDGNFTLDFEYFATRKGLAIFVATDTSTGGNQWLPWLGRTPLGAVVSWTVPWVQTLGDSGLASGVFVLQELVPQVHQHERHRLSKHTRQSRLAQVFNTLIPGFDELDLSASRVAFITAEIGSVRQIPADNTVSEQPGICRATIEVTAARR
jgi:hypothetical protein